MLRGLWLALAGLGVLIQWLPTWFFPPDPDALLYVAWGAAAVYAVGAAVTLFSAEREERTAEFLRHVPVRWAPMFTAKVALALVSAAALALTLSFSGWLVGSDAGMRWHSTAGVLSIAGVAVVEGAVWGILFSLKLRQPLLAAIAAIVAASLGAQAAIELTSNAGPAYLMSSFQQAVPMRLVLCASVFAIDVYFASRWLANPPSASRLSRRRPRALTVARSRCAARRLSFLPRLWWQTCRESWKTMLAAVFLGACLTAAAFMAAGILSQSQGPAVVPVALLSALFLPALFGALVFRADQRHGHREFLAAHAGRPRVIWLARQSFWLAGLMTLAALVSTIVVHLLSARLFEHVEHVARYHNAWAGHDSLPSPWMQVWELEQAAALTWQATVSSWCAFLTAYALGQFCSLLLRSEILAGLLALLLSIVVAAWAALMLSWQLPAWWFVAPIGAGAMLATWLRMPAWMIGSHRARSWLGPVLALALPIVVVAGSVPLTRLAQVSATPPEYAYLKEPLAQSLAQMEAARKEGAATARDYERLAARIVPQEEALRGIDVSVDGKTWDDLPIGDVSGAMKMGEMGGYFGEAAVDEWTPEQRVLSEKLAAMELGAFVEANQHVIEELLLLCRRADCWFPGSVNQPGRSNRQIWSLIYLVFADCDLLMNAGDLEAVLERYVALVRLHGHLTQWQPSSVSAWLHAPIPDQLDAGGRILRWAQDSRQTSEQIKQGIEQLQEAFNALPDPRQALLADREEILPVLTGEAAPMFMAEERRPVFAWLAYALQMLPSEVERSLVALDRITEQNLNFIDAYSLVMQGVNVWNNQQFRTHTWNDDFRNVLQSMRWQGGLSANQFVSDGDWRNFKQMQELAARCKTSFLTAVELEARGYGYYKITSIVDAETRRRALLVQLALEAYRLDHGEYPDSLTDLTPDYLEHLPDDPYANKPFGYRPRGFDLPVAYEGYVPPPVYAAGRPLLWSVGVGNGQPTERAIRLPASDETPADEDQERKKIRAIQFLTDRGHPVYPANLVFPLGE